MKTTSALIWLLQRLPGCTGLIKRIPRPQDPHNRPYKVEAVRFDGGEDGVELDGELTWPTGCGPFAAVVLLSGSGPQDRNESILGHKPFLIISDHLTRQGFAVLRYDDRGVAKSSGNRLEASMYDFAADAAAAFNWLKTHSQIDPDNIGFLGHSEGGYIAPLAARQVPARFLVFLAGPAKPLLPDVLSQQNSDIIRAAGGSEAAIAQATLGVEKLTRILRRSDNVSEVAAALRAYLLEQGATEKHIAQSLGMWANKWAMMYANYNPLPALESYSHPVLALFGSNDLQVSAAENAPVMEAALTHGDSKVIVFSGLNHLFQRSETGRVEEYIRIDTTIEPVVLAEISGWLKGR